MSVVVLALLACSGGTTGGSPTDTAGAFDPLASHEVASADLADLTARHRSQVDGATTRQAIDDEEDAYLSSCLDDQDLLDRCTSMMDQCATGSSTMMGGGGMMGDWADDASQAASDWWDAVQAHHDAMAACDTVQCCHDEEDRWQDDAGSMLDHMDGLSSEWPDGCATTTATGG